MEVTIVRRKAVTLCSNSKMKQLRFAKVLLTAFMSATVSAQVEGQDVSPTRTEVQPMLFGKPLTLDSSRISTAASFSDLQKTKFPVSLSVYDHTSNFTLPMTTSPKPFWLWNGANVTVDGSNYQMQGLMDVATGAVSLHQDFGRLHLAASAIANKYWMPMQSQLITQYGFGGTIGYDVSRTVSLHAFGYYYASNPIVGPAFSPYVNTTTYGGYADIRFNDRFGSNVGVRRYVNPISGRWTTEPIVTPYFRIGKRMKLELPIGNLLKTAIWGDRDNPLRFQPRPMPTP